MSGGIGFLGPCGTFSEEAALLYKKNVPEAPLVECATISEVVERVAAGDLTEGIVPLENTLEGGVGATLDLLAGEAPVLIKAELIYPVRQCLLAGPGVTLARISRVYSHPQALAQCRRFLERELPGAKLCPVESTAAAARLVRGRKRGAAIAARRTAVLFGLRVLAEHIADHGVNATRFVILARRDHPPTGKDKTSLVLSLPDGPGRLHHILGYFARRGVNLTRIESRPARHSPGDWLFFIDCAGHRCDPLLAPLWEELAGAVPFFKFLGSYPRRDEQTRPAHPSLS